jgi:cold shock CspA family protein
MVIGLIKWFDPNKGFGILGTNNEDEFFLHIKNFLIKPSKLVKGTAIIFTKSFDARNNKNIAVNCKTVSTKEDFSLILKSLTEQDNVPIEIKISGTSRHGNPYTKMENVQCSIKTLAVSQLFKSIKPQEIQYIILDYFNNELDKENFIQFCEFIEAAINKNISKEIAEPLKNYIFESFKGKINEFTLFRIWKEKKIRFIGYNDDLDYQIPIEILNKFTEDIGIPELNRIKEFNKGKYFCNLFAINKINNSKKETISEIKELFNFLPFIITIEKEPISLYLTTAVTNKYREKIVEQANAFTEASIIEGVNNYKNLKRIIENGLTEEIKNQLTSEIENIIFSKCSDALKIILWLNGLTKTISLQVISKEFSKYNSELKISILKKFTLLEQFEIIKKFSEKGFYEETYEIIGKFIINENSLDYHFNFFEKILDPEFLRDKIGSDLLNLFNDYVLEKATESEKYNLFLKGLIKEFHLPLAIINAQSLGKTESYKILKTYSSNRNFVYDLIKAKFSTAKEEDLIWIVSYAKEFLDNETLIFLNNELSVILKPRYSFKLWEYGMIDIFPENYFLSTLNDKHEDYHKIRIWIKNGRVSIEKIKTLLLCYLKEKQKVTDRIIFYKQYIHISFLADIDNNIVKIIEDLNNEFYSIILWALGKKVTFNFELLAKLFIYFSPDDQVKIIRKLFYLKAIGNIQLSINDLKKLTRVDLDIYRLSNATNPDFEVDISTEIIINSLINYLQKGKFLVEGELLSMAISGIGPNKKRKIELANYFQDCVGRQIFEYDWKIKGVITKEEFGQNQSYFAIKFEFNQALNQVVTGLPGIKWNNEKSFWGVPSKYEKEVLEFARKYRFKLVMKGDVYANNTHLARFFREDVPQGIIFCEGRLANKKDEIFKRDFWWCANNKCFQKCETIHELGNWEAYTLLDFCEILKLNTDEINKMGDFIPKGHYYQFIGLINRFNRLLEKMYCEECNEILYPLTTSHFASHTTVRFCCENDKCGKYKNEVYLNHCLNGQCNSVIDSRISRSCQNGLFICENCGSCCSHNMLQRRLANLSETGGYIHPNLITCVNEKLGHLERAEYFCFKCESKMLEISTDIFVCKKCKVEYDTVKYKIKRPHRHLSTTNTHNGAK